MWHSTTYTTFQPVRKALIGTAIAMLSFVACHDSTSPSDAINTDSPPPGVRVLTWTYPDSIKNPMVAGSATLIGGAYAPSANVMTAPAPALTLAPPAPSYTVSAVPFAPETAPVTGLGPNCDDCLWIDNPIGFSFAFFGQTYDKINLGSNGIVGFGVNNMRDGCCNGIPMPVNDLYNNVIAIGQNDWMPNAVAKAVRYETRGTAPNRRFVLQYTNVPESGGNGRLTVQIVLSEGTNDITIYTTTLSTTLRTRVFTQGIENATGSEAYFVPGRVQSSFSLTNDAVKFSPPVPNRAPVITPPANITVSTAVPPLDSGTELLSSKGLVPHTGICAADVNPGSPAVIDDAPGVTTTGTRNDGLPLDASYPKGATIITWTAVDAEGLSSSATQTITVSDTEIPSIFAPANISTRTDPGATSATVNVGVASVADNCPNVTVTTSRSDNVPLTSTFPVGTTTIQWIATDASGNTNSTLQKVTVVGNKAPVVTAPAAISVNTDAGVCSAVVNPGVATATDDTEGTTVAGVRNDGGAINGTYPKGVTTITWTATDADGLSAIAPQTVGVSDNEFPSISAPANISTRTNTGASTAAIDVGAPTVADNCPNFAITASRSDNLPLSAVFSIGTTTIKWLATDASGHISTTNQQVTVAGNTPPVVTAPASISVDTDAGICYATLNPGTATATDDGEGVTIAGVRNDGGPVNGLYPKGVTTITWTGTDADHSSAVASQTVTVSDRQKPIVHAPASVSVDNSGGLASAAVSVGTATAEDNCHQVNVSGARSDGGALAGLYPVGTTTITWTAIDASGNSASAAQTVTVRDITIRDVEAPRLSVPSDFEVNATMPSGANVTFAVSATDNLPGVSVSCDHNSGSLFPIGYTDVLCSAVDASGNRASKEFGIKVLSADEQVANLIKYVESLPIRDNASRKLVKELSKALREKSDRKSCDRMDDFIQKVNQGKGISASWASWAAQMTTDALRIESVMGCRPPKHEVRDSKREDKPVRPTPAPAAVSRR